MTRPALLLASLPLMSTCTPSLVEPALAGVVDSAEADVGKPAPDFTLTDVDGARFRLSQQRGRTVVLEWFNPDCPFVRHAHTAGPLATASGRWMERGVTWVAINSGRPGKQGTGAERNRVARSEYGMTAPVLLDEHGAVGRLYGAVTTPQMYVIDNNGILVYSGALDDQPLGRGEGPPRVHVDEVLEAVTAGRPAPYARQKPYGCSVKY